MNFRPKKGKVIGSIIFSIVLLEAFIFYWRSKIPIDSQINPDIVNVMSIIDLNPLSLSNLINLLIIFVIVYIIISIFQRREKVN